MKFFVVFAVVILFLLFGAIYYFKNTESFEMVEYRVDINNSCYGGSTTLVMPQYKKEIIRKSAEAKYLEEARKKGKCIYKMN